MVEAIFVLSAIAGIIGLIYVVVKDNFTYIKNFFKQNDHRNSVEEVMYTQVVRHVNINYITEAGLKELWEKEGYKLRWTSPSNVSSRELSGYEIMYGEDDQRKRKRLLMCITRRLDGDND